MLVDNLLLYGLRNRLVLLEEHGVVTTSLSLGTKVGRVTEHLGTRNVCHMKIADFLIYVTERKTYGSDVKENSGIYDKLPFTSQKRPEADLQI